MHEQGGIFFSTPILLISSNQSIRMWEDQGSSIIFHLRRVRYSADYTLLLSNGKIWNKLFLFWKTPSFFRFNNFFALENIPFYPWKTVSNRLNLITLHIHDKQAVELCFALNGKMSEVRKLIPEIWVASWISQVNKCSWFYSKNPTYQSTLLYIGKISIDREPWLSINRLSLPSNPSLTKEKLLYWFTININIQG